ncbi:hypothetical protein V6N13_049260 [Hibiscus sabdariffa]
MGVLVRPNVMIRRWICLSWSMGFYKRRRWDETMGKVEVVIACKCTSRESNPGLYRGRTLFYHWCLMTRGEIK